MRIVLDLAWGASVNIAPNIFRQLEATVFSLHEEPIGDLINVNCGSTNLRLLQQAVKKYKADLVIFNHDLSPSQERNLEKELQTRVVNYKSFLINP